MNAKDLHSGLSHASLHQQLTYNKKSGEFHWRVDGPRSSSPKKGSRAGRQRVDGYIDLRVNKRLYLEHRLAWFYIKGFWPDSQLDHKNGVRNQNFFKNLRQATKSQNQQNTQGHKSRRSEFKGVHRRILASGIVWRATIKHEHTVYNLGHFQDELEAHFVYLVAEQFFFGKFAGSSR